jgi:hypothetical protein
MDTFLSEMHVEDLVAYDEYLLQCQWSMAEADLWAEAEMHNPKYY